jgi:formylglycine-generating enzyme required for sulfatase activity
MNHPTCVFRRAFVVTATAIAGLAAVVAVTIASALRGAENNRDVPPAMALPKTASVDLGDGVTMDFVLIPAGSFEMGSDENTGEGDESPIHNVTLTRPFYLGKCEVTQEQWQQVMGNNPSDFRGAKLPVDTVSWNDCQEFFAKVKTRTGRTFTLPTEAQWEYACRAATSTPWSFGDKDTLATDYAWLGDNSGGTTHPVGTKKPNAWGLYDMHGNVWEWCADFYTKHAYDTNAPVDPLGPPASEGRILRGGAWGDAPEGIRCAVRNTNGPDGKHNGIGFRCVLVIDAPHD